MSEVSVCNRLKPHKMSQRIPKTITELFEKYDIVSAEPHQTSRSLIATNVVEFSSFLFSTPLH